MPMSSMENRGSLYSSQIPYMGSYISPTPSIYPGSYDASPPMTSTYPPLGTVHARASQDWADQDITLFSHSERAIAKERRREQNRASQRAYRKRKEDTVRGLYDSIKDLRKDSEALRAENKDLKSELRKLHEENRKLRSRASSLKSCMQCSEAGLTCSKTNATCKRCEETGLTCNSPSPELTSRHPTIELSDQEDNVQEPIYNQSVTKSDWYDAQSQVPMISESISEGAASLYDVSTYDSHDLQRRAHSPYDMENEGNMLQAQVSEGYSSLLQPGQRPMYRSQSLQTLGNPNEQTRPRSTSLYRVDGA